MKPDPDLIPVKPYDGAPDHPGVVRRWASGAKVYADAPKIAPANPDLWDVVVPLRHPLLVDDVLLDKVSIRRLTGEDVVNLIMEDDDYLTLPRRARALAAGVHPAVLSALSSDDADEVAERIRPFLPSSLVDAELAEAMDQDEPDLPADL